MALEGIKWRSVESSNIDAIALQDEDDHLYVRFTNGSVYRYHDDYLTGRQLYQALVEADDNPDLSVGSVFHKVVRANVPGVKVGD